MIWLQTVYNFEGNKYKAVKKLCSIFFSYKEKYSKNIDQRKKKMMDGR